MMGVVLDLCAQGGNAAVHTAIINHDVMPPNGIQNLIAGDRTTGSLHEKFEEPKFFCGESDLTILSKKFVGSEIEAAVAKLINRRSSRLTPAEKCFGAGQQFADAEWLGDIIIRAQFQPANDVFFLPFGGEHDNRHFELALAHKAADFVA